MNPVTFNGSFSRVLSSLDCDSRISGRIRECLEAPLIEWDRPVSMEGMSESSEPLPNGCPRLPFERFRFSVKTPNGMNLDQVPGRSLNYLVAEDDYESGPGYFIAVDVSGVSSIYPKGFVVLGTCEFINQEPLLKMRGFHPKFGTMKNLNCGPLDADKDGFPWHGMMWAMVWQLVDDFTNPHLHFVKKSPPNPSNKSIEWVKAREHYVLIHKSHAANKKEAIGKKLVIDGDTTARAAHSRRAHFRLLSSPKFRHKMGLRVWVRSSWCGPKEWTDRSGQIYRIVDRAA